MGPTSLRRFIISYSVLVTLVVAVCGYCISQLGRLSAAAHYALQFDQRMLDDAERLADSFLSEVRYAGKFVVTQAPDHYEQYRLFNNDFRAQLDKMKALAVADDAKRSLARAEEYHTQFQHLFEQEIEYIKRKQPYAESRYGQEKERLVEYLLREHDAFKGQRQSSLQQRIAYIESAAVQSQRFTIVATLLLVVLGIGFGFWLTGKGWKFQVGAAVSRFSALCAARYPRKISLRIWVLLPLSFLFGCSTLMPTSEPVVSNSRPEPKIVQQPRAPFERSSSLFAQGQYEAAFIENQKILNDGSGAPDLALFNMGMISAYSSNPSRNYARALTSFRSLVKEYPKSDMVEPAKTWIQVLEEHQKLAEEKRALIKEREALVQEKEKLRYAIEKSQQVDMNIEKRRRETLRK